MKYIKTFESKKPQRESAKGKEAAEKEFVGNIYKIYPTHNPSEMIVIAKCVKILGMYNNWGLFEGYKIYPPMSKGKFYTDTEFLSGIGKENEASKEEIEEYELYDKMNS